jgi:hypothetical protein
MEDVDGITLKDWRQAFAAGDRGREQDGEELKTAAERASRQNVHGCPNDGIHEDR